MFHDTVKNILYKIHERLDKSMCYRYDWISRSAFNNINKMLDNKNRNVYKFQKKKVR